MFFFLLTVYNNGFKVELIRSIIFIDVSIFPIYAHILKDGVPLPEYL